MGVMTPRAGSTRSDAFDGVAAGYDRSNSRQPDPVRDARARASRRSRRTCRPASHLLDLGCGPGTDAADLGRAGYRVTAIDWSPAMVEQARRRVARRRRRRPRRRPAPRHPRARSAGAGGAPFDAAYSNFGPLNCVADLPRAARRIAARLAPGGVLVASVIGRVCPWEIALYLARGDLARARDPVSPRPRARCRSTAARSGRGTSARASSSAIFAAAGMTRVSLRALGLFVPPPYLAGVRRSPPVARSTALQRVEDRCGGWPLLRGVGRSLPHRDAEGLSRVVAALRLPRVPHRSRRDRGRALRVRALRPRVRPPRRRLALSAPRARRAARAVHPPVPRRPRSATGAVRRAPDYYRRLPSVAPGDPHAREWQIRRETYHHLLGHVLAAGALPLHVLDLGAGSGWLSHRLTALGHRAVAVDALDDEVDGLGAARHYADRLRDGAGRLRRAAVRAGAVRSRRLQRLAALRRRHRRDARARASRARAGRRAGGDGLADVSRRRRRHGDGRRAAERFTTSAAAPTSFSPAWASDVRALAGIAASWRCGRSSSRRAARSAGGSGAASRACGCAARRRRSVCGWRDDRALQPAVDDARASSRCRCR